MVSWGPLRSDIVCHLLSCWKWKEVWEGVRYRGTHCMYEGRRVGSTYEQECLTFKQGTFKYSTIEVGILLP